MKKGTQPGHRRPADEAIDNLYAVMMRGARLLGATAAGAELYQTTAGRYFVLDAAGIIHPLTAADAAALAVDITLQEGNTTWSSA